MADIYVPGVKSRFDTEKLIEGLMAVERVPKTRIEDNVKSLESQKGYWQELGRRMTALRDQARSLYSYQNPFNARTAVSDDTAVIAAEAGRDAAQGENHEYVVKEKAAADRFLSAPQASDTQVPAGKYTLRAGDKSISFNYKGGDTRDFAATLTAKGDGSFAARVLSVRPGTTSLLVESLVTGADNHLTFADDAEKMALQLGIIKEGTAPMGDSVVSGATQLEPQGDTTAATPPPEKVFNIRPVAANEGQGSPALAGAPALAGSPALAGAVTGEGMDAVLAIRQGAEAKVLLDAAFTTAAGIDTGASYMLRFETAAAPLVQPSAAPMTQTAAQSEGTAQDSPPPSAKGAVSLVFADGTRSPVATFDAGAEYAQKEYDIAPLAAGREVAAVIYGNVNAATPPDGGGVDLDIRNITLADRNDLVAFEKQQEQLSSSRADALPLTTRGTASEGDPAIASAGGEQIPLNPVSRARDAVVLMDGIEIHRPTNTIDDLVPGVKLSVKAVSDKPVKVGVDVDTQPVKDAVITLVGNYNRLMAELNVLSRNDDAVIRELTYLDDKEREEMTKRLGAFSADSSLAQLRSNLQALMQAPYRSSSGQPLLLANFGIQTDTRRGGGYDASRLRGYLEIDETALDNAIAANLPGLKDLMGRDTDGDLIVDSGAAFELDRTLRPWVETGGVIALKNSQIDTKIASDKRRVDTIDRQLASKEQQLKNDYARMESAYNEMERMSNSLQNFGSSGSK